MAPIAGITTAQWGQEEWANNIWQGLSVASALFRSPVQRLIIDGKIGHFPRVSVQPPAAWVAELDDLPSNDGVDDALILTPKKLGNMIVLSNEVREDSNADVLDGIADSLTRGLAASIDATAFSTDPATTIAPAGLLSTLTPLETESGAAVDIDSLLDGIGQVESEGGTPNAIYLHPQDLTALRKLRATDTGQYLLAPGGQTGDLSQRPVESVGGAILYPTSGIATGSALVCDTNFVALGVSRDVAVEVSTDAEFERDAAVARVTARFDWQIADPKAVAWIA
ncbi:MAG: phage major capsid protein [Solirubrobacterales bacterium]|nr:phage major capsid protein [Solirubrobacterales bacterium]